MMIMMMMLLCVSFTVLSRKLHDCSISAFVLLSRQINNSHNNDNIQIGMWYAPGDLLWINDTGC